MYTEKTICCFYCEARSGAKSVIPISELYAVMVDPIYETEMGFRTNNLKSYTGPSRVYYCRKHFNNGQPLEPPLYMLSVAGSTCISCDVTIP